MKLAHWPRVLVRPNLGFQISPLTRISSETPESFGTESDKANRPRRALSTGKSLSEVLIFALTNPHYEDRLFIELQLQYMKIPSSEHGENMLSTEIVPDY